MAHKLANGKYRVLIRRAGHPKVDRIFESHQEAEEFEARTRAEIDGAHALWSPKMTFAEAARQYQQSILSTAKAGNTLITEKTRLRPAIAALGEYSLESLENGQRIVAYRDNRGTYVSKKTGRPLRPDSIRLELAAIAAVFAWAVESRILLRNPASGIRRPRGKPRNRRMFEHEKFGVAVAASASPLGENPGLAEAARFVAVQRELGCRPGELAALRREDVDLESRAAIFRDTKHEQEDRTTHLSQQATDCLGTQLAYAAGEHPASPFVFTSLSRTGKVCVPVNYRRFVQELRDAGVVEGDYYAHVARRDHVSNAFENGLSHADVMLVTGHRSYAAVQAYNKSQILHPKVRERLDNEAAIRSSDRARSLAEHLGVSIKDLEEFIKSRGRKKLESGAKKSTPHKSASSSGAAK